MKSVYRSLKVSKKNAKPGDLIKAAQKKMMKNKPMLNRRKLTPEYKATLKAQAPETLKSPSKKQFADDGSYRSANQAFKQFGHWASEGKGKGDWTNSGMLLKKKSMKKKYKKMSMAEYEGSPMDMRKDKEEMAALMKKKGMKKQTKKSAMKKSSKMCKKHGMKHKMGAC